MARPPCNTTEGSSTFGRRSVLKRLPPPAVDCGSSNIGTAFIMQQRWPERLWIVRHGESAGNVAREAADAAGLGADRHRRARRRRAAQRAGRGTGAGARATGSPRCRKMSGPRWCSPLPTSAPGRTAEIVQAGGGLHVDVADFLIDERLREKEFGVLDRLTRRGIEEEFPDQAEFRRLLGKFYHRPPAGESWCDVILRLRSALDTISLHHCGRRVRDRQPSGRRAVPALPAGEHDRGTDPGHRPGGRRRQLLGHRIPLQP